jgi:hypothetical protein
LVEPEGGVNAALFWGVEVSNRNVGDDMLDTVWCMPKRKLQPTGIQARAVSSANNAGRLCDRPGHWRVALNVNNIFNRIYYQTLGDHVGGYWYGEPRNFLVRIEARY